MDHQPLLVLGAAFAAAIGFYPFLRSRAATRWWVCLIAVAALLAMPFLLLQEAGLHRVVLAIVCGLLALKIVDLSIGAARGHRPDFASYLAYLPNVGLLVFRKTPAVRSMPARENFRRFLHAMVLIGLALLLLEGLFLVSWRDWPFAVEHTVKALGFFIGVLGIFELITVLLRLSGAPARRPHDAPLTARTPAEFWRRYNRIVQQFFHENVFRPIGGMRTPIAGTLLVFLLSGTLHEYAFSLGAGHFQGYQLAYFIIHGFATVATLRIRPAGWTIALWVLGTLVFNLFTGLLFLASLHQIVPMYANPLPAWLEGW